MSISNLLVPNNYNLYCNNIITNSETSYNQIINLPATEFVIPDNTDVDFTPSLGFYLPAFTRQPTSITLFYKEGGGGNTECFVEIRSISNVPIIYYKDQIPTSSNPAKIMTQLIDLPLTSNLLMIGFSANAVVGGAGSLFPINLHINY